MALLKAFLGILLLVPAALFAQQRTFVSTSGLDTNPCSATQPCRTFGAALAVTTSGGEVIALTSGGYGPASITQPVSVIAPPGVYAGISVPSGTGLTINAAGGTVSLRGLTLTGLGGSDGINLAAANELHTSNLTVAGFTLGLHVSAASVRFTVRDSLYRDNGWGIYLENATFAEGTIDRTRLDLNNNSAVVQQDNSIITARDSVFFGSGFAGTVLTPGTAAAQLFVDNCLFAGNNDGIVILASGNGNGQARFTHSSFANMTGTAILRSGAGTLASFGDNAFAGNNADGSPDIMIARK